MFRALSAHLQEDIVVYMQHMVLSLSMRVHGGLSVHSSCCVPTGHKELWQYHMLHVYNCILLKMSTWGSKHVEKNSILCINYNQCIKLVINIYLLYPRYRVTNKPHLFMRTQKLLKNNSKGHMQYTVSYPYNTHLPNAWPLVTILK